MESYSVFLYSSPNILSITRSRHPLQSREISIFTQIETKKKRNIPFSQRGEKLLSEAIRIGS